MEGIAILGTVVTRETAPGFLARVARVLLNPVTIASSMVLTDIEEKLMGAGMITRDEAEKIEDAAY